MNNKVFGEVTFNMGWELSSDIKLLGKLFPITICAKAYYESEEITEEQEFSYEEYLSKKESIVLKIEEVMCKEAGTKESALNRFTPKMLLFQANGDYALIIDDIDDIENGIVICVKPEFEILTTDEYF